MTFRGLLDNLRHLFRYRALVLSLIAREIKARYRGSVLGFCWSLVNPLLLLLVYTFVFTVVMPGSRGTEWEPYAVFMFCGFLPWTWFQSSVLEASGVLIAGGNLIRKVLFPAEILPIVTIFAGLVHFGLGLPILAAFIVYYKVPVTASDLLWFPLLVLIQLTAMLGLALLVSVLTVHFRDMRDLLVNALTLWFFATPILYPLAAAPPQVRGWLGLNPWAHLAVAYQEVLFVPGPFGDWGRVAGLGLGAVLVLGFGYAVFDRLRDTLAEEV